MRARAQRAICAFSNRAIVRFRTVTFLPKSKRGHKELIEASIATPPFRLATLAGNPFANAVPQRNPNDKSDCDFQHRDTGVEPLSLTIRDRQSNQYGGYRLLGWTCCCPCAAVSCSSAKRCQIWAIFLEWPSRLRVGGCGRPLNTLVRDADILLPCSPRPVAPFIVNKRSWRRGGNDKQ
jgi:hypothetical protein